MCGFAYTFDYLSQYDELQLLSRCAYTYKDLPPPPQQHKPSVFHVIFLICVRKMGCMKVGGKLYIDDGEEQQRLFTSVERVAETVLEMLKPCQHHFAGTKYRRGISSCSGRFATLWQ